MAETTVADYLTTLCFCFFVSSEQSSVSITFLFTSCDFGSADTFCFVYIA
jgi:hypothetical protein